LAEKKEKVRFRKDMAESVRAAPKGNPDLLPSESGYTRTNKSKLKGNSDYGKNLRFGKKVEKPKASRKVSSAAMSARMHAALESENQDENAGTKALNRGTEAAEDTGRAAEEIAGRVKYSKKLKASRQASRLQMDAEYGSRMRDTANAASNKAGSASATGSDTAEGKAYSHSGSGNSSFFSRWKQRQEIKKQYAAARRAGQNAEAAGTAAADGTKKAGKGIADIGANIKRFVSEHSGMLITMGVLGLVFLLIISSFSSCSMFATGTGNSILGSSYTAEDEAIQGANNDYKAMEADLQSQIDNVRSTHPGYDEYQFDLANINHNPYVLTSYLTVLYEDYTEAEVQSKLRELFEAQYQLTFREEIQIRTRTEERTGHRTVRDPDTGESSSEEYTYEVEVQYEYKILHVKLVNRTMEACISRAGLTDVQQARYALLNETKGNRDYLFADDVYSNPSAGEYTDYDVPTEALSDEKFANMLQEAEKYLGYPYVWGGSSPSTSFDCSGFVCWVINHSGNGWNVGRTTAEGLRQMLTIIPPGEAKPGDIIFFQGTYDTPGASHVGIYVGNGMMIHCGNPIQYASVNSSYFQQHFYCYGRLP
jgi:cell wall-associated NlpC family hydrolase